MSELELVFDVGYSPALLLCGESNGKTEKQTRYQHRFVHPGNLYRMSAASQRRRRCLSNIKRIYSNNVTTFTCWFDHASFRKAISPTRPKTSLPVMGNLDTEIFSGPNLATDLRL